MYVSGIGMWLLRDALVMRARKLDGTDSPRYLAYVGFGLACYPISEKQPGSYRNLEDSSSKEWEVSNAGFDF